MKTRPLHPMAAQARDLWRARRVADGVGVALDTDAAFEPVPLDPDGDDPPSVCFVPANPETLLQAGLVRYAVPHEGKLLLTLTVEDLVAQGERELLGAYLDTLSAETIDEAPTRRALRHFARGEPDRITEQLGERESLFDDGLIPALLRGQARNDVAGALAEVRAQLVDEGPELMARAAVFLGYAGERQESEALLTEAEARAAFFSSDAYVQVAWGVWDVLSARERTLGLIERAERGARPWFAGLRPRAACIASTAHVAAARARFCLLGDLSGARAALDAAIALTARSPRLGLELAGDAFVLLDDRELVATLVARARDALGSKDEDVLLMEKHALGRG
jgi:hypothetical protein